MQIFSVYKELSLVEVSVYESIEDFTMRTEWQDMLGDYFTIIDAAGNVYKWDDTKTEEYATVYNYTLQVAQVDRELGAFCVLHHRLNEFADEFTVSL